MKSFPLEMVSPNDTKTELVCGIAKTTLAYFRDQLGEEVVRDTVAASCMNYEYLVDDRNWMSMRYYCTLLDALVERSGKADAAYEAGQYGARGDCMGLVKILFAGGLTPRAAYRFWVYSSSHWNHVADWAVLEMDRDHCRLSTTLRPGFTNTRNNCLAIQGFLATIPRLWNLPPAKVTETQCNCIGAECCVYDVRWINPPSFRWALMGGLTGGAIGAILFSVGLFPLSCEILLIAVGLSVGLNVHYRQMNRMLISQNCEQIVSLENTVRDIEQLNALLQQKVEGRTEELTRTLQQLKDVQKKEVLIERQAAIGALAAGMAHELNNPLHAVSVSVQGLKADLQSNPDYEPFIANIERSTRRCRRIIGEILSFSRESKSSRANLPVIVRAAVDTFQNEHSASLSLELHIPPNLPDIFLDAGQVRQALINLLMNAADAMGGKGLIQVGVEREASDVVLSVRDSGPGMTEEVKNRIFDPFFSTKQKGMGLGLSITWQLIQKNGGAIEVESQVGHGSLFRIRFPIPVEVT